MAAKLAKKVDISKLLGVFLLNICRYELFIIPLHMMNKKKTNDNAQRAVLDERKDE